MATRPFLRFLALRASPGERGLKSLRTVALAFFLSIAACEPKTSSGPTLPADGDTTPEASPAPELDTAVRKLASGDSRAARAGLENVLSRQPENSRARFYLGLTYYREHRYERAAELFRRSREAGSSFQGADDVAHFHGWSLFHLGRLDEARVAFETHLGKSPESADTLSGMGRIAWETGRLEDAAGYLKRALEAERGERRRPARIAKYLVQLADVHTRQGQTHEALAELNAAALAQPDHYSVYYKLYQLYSERGESARAADAYRRYQASWAARKTPGS